MGATEGQVGRFNLQQLASDWRGTKDRDKVSVSVDQKAILKDW